LVHSLSFSLFVQKEENLQKARICTQANTHLYNQDGQKKSEKEIEFREQDEFVLEPLSSEVRAATSGYVFRTHHFAIFFLLLKLL
jgi:hypothetical protein